MGSWWMSSRETNDVNMSHMTCFLELSNHNWWGINSHGDSSRGSVEEDRRKTVFNPCCTSSYSLYYPFWKLLQSQTKIIGRLKKNGQEVDKKINLVNYTFKSWREGLVPLVATHAAVTEAQGSCTTPSQPAWSFQITKYISSHIQCYLYLFSVIFSVLRYKKLIPDILTVLTQILSKLKLPVHLGKWENVFLCHMYKLLCSINIT